MCCLPDRAVVRPARREGGQSIFCAGSHFNIDRVASRCCLSFYEWELSVIMGDGRRYDRSDGRTGQASVDMNART